MVAIPIYSRNDQQHRGQQHLANDSAHVIPTTSSQQQETHSDLDVLKDRMKFYGLKEKTVIEGDGNCQFRAIADQLFNNQELHYALRNKIVDWLRHNRHFRIDANTELKDFLETECYRNWDTYCEYMAKEGTWGDHITLLVAAELFNVTICVLSSVETPGNTEAITVIEPRGKSSVRTLYLSHWIELHYGSLCLDTQSPRLAAAISKQVTTGPVTEKPAEKEKETSKKAAEIEVRRVSLSLSDEDDDASSSEEDDDDRMSGTTENATFADKHSVGLPVPIRPQQRPSPDESVIIPVHRVPVTSTTTTSTPIWSSSPSQRISVSGGRIPIQIVEKRSKPTPQHVPLYHTYQQQPARPQPVPNLYRSFFDPYRPSSRASDPFGDPFRLFFSQ